MEKLLEFLRHRIGLLADCVASKDPTIVEHREMLRASVDAIVALQADAQRLNGVRMVICEQDKTLRERMGEAMTTVFEAWAYTLTHETIVTPEAFNAMVDAMLLAACEARK